MAKKITERLLKDGNVHYYVGGKKISDKEKRSFFKSQINSSGFEKDRLSKSDQLLFSRIKGGVNAAKKAIRLDNGQIVKGDIGRAAKKLGIDLDAGLKATGFKTLKELEQNKTEFFKALDDYLKGGFTANWYSPENAKNIISDYRGVDILLNGEKVSKSQMKNRLSEFNQELLHVLGSDAYQSAVKITFKGTHTMEINLPEIEDLDDGITVQDFMEAYGDDNSGMYKIFGSPTPAK